MESREKDMSKKENLSNKGVKRVNPLPFDNMHELFKTSKVGIRETKHGENSR